MNDDEGSNNLMPRYIILHEGFDDQFVADCVWMSADVGTTGAVAAGTE